MPLKSWEVNDAAYYVGVQVGPRSFRLLFGPVHTEERAEACIAPVGELTNNVEPPLESPDLQVIEETVTARWMHRLGELNAFFSRGLLIADRDVDTVEYWRSPHEPNVARWVIFHSDEPKLVVRQGQIDLTVGRRRDLEAIVRADVARHDPVAALDVRKYFEDGRERETSANQPHLFRSRSATDLDVGVIAVDPSDSMLKPITYWRRYRTRENSRFSIDISFDPQHPRASAVTYDEQSVFETLDVCGIEVARPPALRDEFYMAPRMSGPANPEQPVLFDGMEVG